MGVLSCDRKGCNNIMCDRLSYEHGYLCRKCFDELVDLGVGADIHKFMETEKPSKIFDSTTDTFAYYNSIFKLRGIL